MRLSLNSVQWSTEVNNQVMQTTTIHLLIMLLGAHSPHSLIQFFLLSLFVIFHKIQTHRGCLLEDVSVSGHESVLFPLKLAGVSNACLALRVHETG